MQHRLPTYLRASLFRCVRPFGERTNGKIDFHKHKKPLFEPRHLSAEQKDHERVLFGTGYEKSQYKSRNALALEDTASNEQKADKVASKEDQ